MKTISVEKDYRIPIIEEFIKGFYYEVYSDGYFDDIIGDFCDWYGYEFLQGYDWRDIDDIKECLDNGYIRCQIN